MKTQARRTKPAKAHVKSASRTKPVARKSAPSRTAVRPKVNPKPIRSKPAVKGKSPAPAPRSPAVPGRPVAVAPPPRPVPVPPPQPDKQQIMYEEAVRLFHAQKFERADALFQKAMQGANRALAHHAQMHSQICQKRLRPAEVKLRTAEDHYNYAITMINARRLSEAAEHLEVALRLEPHADHLHYAMAAAQALQGNRQAAYERLKAAIDIQPRNRILARGDSDFAGILEYPPVATLLRIA